MAVAVVPLARAALVQVAEQRDADEDQADDEHREDDVAALLGSRLLGRREEIEEGGSIAAMLQNEPGMRDEGCVDRHVTRRDPRDLVERACIAVLPERRTGTFETARTERRRRRSPGRAVAVTALGTRLRAQRDQLGEIRNCGDVARVRHMHEAVRVQVVAEEERRVAIWRREEPRATVVDEVALVDRLQPEGVIGRSKRGEDRLVRALLRRKRSLLPERALRRGGLDDRVEHEP